VQFSERLWASAAVRHSWRTLGARSGESQAIYSRLGPTPADSHPSNLVSLLVFSLAVDDGPVLITQRSEGSNPSPATKSLDGREFPPGLSISTSPTGEGFEPGARRIRGEWLDCSRGERASTREQNAGRRPAVNPPPATKFLLPGSCPGLCV